MPVGSVYRTAGFNGFSTSGGGSSSGGGAGFVRLIVGFPGYGFRSMRRFSTSGTPGECDSAHGYAWSY